MDIPQCIKTDHNDPFYVLAHNSPVRLLYTDIIVGKVSLNKDTD
jgi:hypothetical protein